MVFRGRIKPAMGNDQDQASPSHDASFRWNYTCREVFGIVAKLLHAFIEVQHLIVNIIIIF